MALGKLAAASAAALFTAMLFAAPDEPSYASLDGGMASAGTGAAWHRDAPEKYWNFAALEKCPEFRKSPFADSDWPGLQALLVKGKGPGGSEAEFFAYYAAPTNPAPAGGHPGVVLVHGGGGTAYPQYVERWVRKGFAVIAPDWYNQRPLSATVKGLPSGTKIPRAPLPGGRRNDIVANVANMVLLHSLLRSFPEVDAERTVFVGLSWGSWYGAIVSAVDPRFKGVVEIYCGDVKRNKPNWLVNGRFLHAAKCPMWWVAGTNDRNVTPASLQEGFDECAFHWGHAIVMRLPHSHCGFDFDSPVRMARHFACGEPALPRLGKIRIEGGMATAPIVSRGLKPGKAFLAYTCDAGQSVRWKREWKSVPAEVSESSVSATVPEGACQMFFSLYEEEAGKFNDLCGSSDILTLDAAPAAESSRGIGTRIVARERESGWTRIGYELRPTTSSYIRCELALPDPEKWDGRLWGHGNGGWAGRVLCLRGMDGDTSAHVQCDLGTSLWQTNNPCPAPKEVVDDFVWRATHLMTVEAKRLVREFYGRDPHHCYFTGASTGGRQAIFEACLFPEDYNGIIAEVPYINWPDASAYEWRAQELRRRHGAWFSEKERETVRQAELAYFAATDPEWARGYFIVDPRPTPEKLDGCWREIVKTDPRLADRESLWRALFEPVVVRGRRMACGAAIGAEFYNRWSFMYSRCIGPIGAGGITEETMTRLFDRLAVDRGNPDLEPFHKAGGKLLMYAGYEDASVPAPPVTAFYEAAARNCGGYDKTQEFFRYFAVPGRSHGALGAAFGKGHVGRAPEIIKRMIDWVEHDTAPESLEFTFAARHARLAVSPYPGTTVRLAPESEAERLERTGVRPLGERPGDVLEGVTINGHSVQADGGCVSPRSVRRTAKLGALEIESCEMPVPGEPAKAFSLSIRNVGDSAEKAVLRLSDPARMSWHGIRGIGGDRSVVEVGPIRPGEQRKLFGGRITTDSPHARWYLGKFFEDGDGIFARCTWAPLAR